MLYILAKRPKWTTDMANVMNRDEYLGALKELGITQQRAAWLFNGKSERSGRRWAREGAPYHVALIIALMQEFELTPEHIEALGRQWRPNQEQDNAEEDYFEEETAS